MSDTKRPEITNEILIVLYTSNIRSSNLKKIIQDKYPISNPTFYMILKELAMLDYIEKNEISPRNVQYSLTENGKIFLEKHYFTMRENYLKSLKQLPEQDFIIMDVIIHKVKAEFINNSMIEIPDDIDELIKDLGTPIVNNIVPILVEQLLPLIEARSHG